MAEAEAVGAELIDVILQEGFGAAVEGGLPVDDEGAAAFDVGEGVAGAGGAAHLPGMMASKTRVPVVGVPVQTKALSGLDSLYSIVQMPKGFPVATMAIGAAGAANAGLMAAGILAVSDIALAERLDAWRDALSASIPEVPTDE